jgi:hypothetical protein
MGQGVEQLSQTKRIESHKVTEKTLHALKCKEAVMVEEEFVCRLGWR